MDFSSSSRHSLREFDGREVGRLENAMWRSYYDHQPTRLFMQLGALLRQQYHMPFWRSSLAAYHAARGAVVFQRGHNLAEYEFALPDLVSFYELVQQSSTETFDVHEAAAAELEWWIIHRERSLHQTQDLEASLAHIQAILYQRPDEDFAIHARWRAQAMTLRDDQAVQAPLRDEDWNRIGSMLERSWSSLSEMVTASRR